MFSSAMVCVFTEFKLTVHTTSSFHYIFVEIGKCRVKPKVGSCSPAKRIYPIIIMSSFKCAKGGVILKTKGDGFENKNNSVFCKNMNTEYKIFVYLQINNSHNMKDKGKYYPFTINTSHISDPKNKRRWRKGHKTHSFETASVGHLIPSKVCEILIVSRCPSVPHLVIKDTK